MSADVMQTVDESDFLFLLKRVIAGAGYWKW